MQSPVEIGSIVAGKYRIDRVIGQGGMGIVFAALHDELDQQVAIKFLSPEGAKGVEWIGRFAREAKTAAKIKNEHAVKVFDVGRLETGIPYMVMEYLEGKNLDEILEERKTLPIDETCDYILQACEALAEAHVLGIVHRDLKPANLFLTHRSDGTTCVKILDFGISKVDESLLGSGVVTHTTSLVGSPLYMSPERLKGAKDVDRRADIWSLGVLLQEMLTGTPAFNADTIPEIHAMVLTNPPTPLRRDCPHAPPELQAIVEKCLEKLPDARFQNVKEFATALGAIAPGSQGSVERIARITVGGSGPRSRLSYTDFGSSSISGSYPPAPPSAPAAHLAVTGVAARDLADSGPLPPRSVPPSSESIPTVSATGTLGDALKKSSGKFAVVGIFAIAIAAFATVALRRSHRLAPATSLVSARATASASPTPTETQLAPPTSIPFATWTDVEEVATPGHSATQKATRPNRPINPASVASHAAEPVPSVAPPPAAQDAGLVIDYGGRN